ncbi:unnamed protein product [Angiostrongylus costaricensis]|uniref:Ovule protein n=1 Tax=Angiostrongylus costaricensis TaxID=334426 RepID=A0A0R3PYU7_ANGCS|nr:unnamed protein product [Angiostrongylus costaricensis]
MEIIVPLLRPSCSESSQTVVARVFASTSAPIRHRQVHWVFFIFKVQIQITRWERHEPSDTLSCHLIMIRLPVVTNLSSTVELYVCFSCDHWRNNGFCNNTFYSTAQRRFYCGKFSCKKKGREGYLGSFP